MVSGYEVSGHRSFGRELWVGLYFGFAACRCCCLSSFFSPFVSVVSLGIYGIDPFDGLWSPRS